MPSIDSGISGVNIVDTIVYWAIISHNQEYFKQEYGRL